MPYSHRIIAVSQTRIFVREAATRIMLRRDASPTPPDVEVLAIVAPGTQNVAAPNCLADRQEGDDLALPVGASRIWLHAETVVVKGDAFIGTILLAPTCSKKSYVVDLQLVAEVDVRWVNEPTHGQCKDMPGGAPVDVSN